MEIKVSLNSGCMSGYDTGGAVRDIEATITIDKDLHPRLKRHCAIYETLGCLLGYVLSHEQLEEIAEKLTDILDQLEPTGFEEK